MDFLKNNNLTPLIIMAIISIALGYFYIEGKIEHKMELAQKQAEIDLANKNQGDIQAYNMIKFNALEKVDNTQWEEGEHEVTLFLNQ